MSLTSSEVTCTARATTDTTHASIEQIGTMSTNIALDYYNHYPEATMPWIERAEKALDLLAEHNERSQQPSNEPIMRVKLQMIKAILYATNGQTELATKTYNKVMASSYANHPILISDKMAYLEKTGQWDAAADLVPQFADLNAAQSRTTTSQCSAYASAKAMRLNLLGKIMAIKQQLSKIICTFAVVKRKRQA